MRLSVCVSQGSIFEPKTTLTDEARGAKAAADAGRSWTGMLVKRRRGEESLSGAERSGGISLNGTETGTF